MREHRLEVADVFRQHGEEFLKQWGHTLSLQQRKALRDIGACRTAALGGSRRVRSRRAPVMRIVGVGQSGAGHPAVKTHMVEFAAQRSQARFYIAKAVSISELRKSH